MKVSGIFSSKSDQQFYKNAIQSKLDKAEALSVVATLVDFNAVNDKILENYLWTLSEMIQEAKSLYHLSLST